MTITEFPVTACNVVVADIDDDNQHGMIRIVKYRKGKIQKETIVRTW